VPHAEIQVPLPARHVLQHDAIQQALLALPDRGVERAGANSFAS
jgi:hypothetical protein